MTGTDRYDYAFDPNGDAWAARILRRLAPSLDVLELGPGPGAMTRVMLAGGHRVVVIENDPDAVDALTALGIDVVNVDLDTEHWGQRLRERRFDAVLACDVLEHLRRPEGVLCSLREQIKPGGRLIVSIPNIAYAGVLAALRNGNFNYADKGQLDRTHIHFFTRKSFETMLLASGWIPVAWEAHRVEISDSEFSGEWGLLANTVRESLSADWPDFNVYQWMVEAVPANEAGWQHVSQMALQAAKAEMDVFKAELMTLNDVHQREHESLLEHQKAFGEAKVIIDDLRRQLANAEIERKVVLERALSADEGASERGWLKKLLPFLRSKPAGGAGE